MWIDRQIEPLLRQRAETRPVVVLTGARQTGKTSLMRRLFLLHRGGTFRIGGGVAVEPLHGAAAWR